MWWTLLTNLINYQDFNVPFTNLIYIYIYISIRIYFSRSSPTQCPKVTFYAAWSISRSGTGQQWLHLLGCNIIRCVITEQCGVLSAVAVPHLHPCNLCDRCFSPSSHANPNITAPGLLVNCTGSERTLISALSGSGVLHGWTLVAISN